MADDESWRDPAVLDALSRASIEALSRRPIHTSDEPVIRRAPRNANDTLARRPLRARVPVTPAVLHAVAPAASERLDVALQHAAVGLALLDAEHHVAWINAAACTLAGRTPEELIGASPDFLELPATATASDEAADPAAEIWSPLVDPSEWRARSCRRPDGSEQAVLVHSSAILDATGGAVSYLLEMVDPARCRTPGTADSQPPLIDSLTGLPGRSLLLDRLQHALVRSERSGSAVAVVRLRFEMDGVGGVRPVHTRRVFLAASRRLQAALRATDTVAFVGDGFILVCEEIADSEVRTVADRVIEAVRAPFNIDGKPTPVTIRAGVSVGRAPQTTSHRLLEDAEANVS